MYSCICWFSWACSDRQLLLSSGDNHVFLICPSSSRSHWPVLILHTQPGMARLMTNSKCWVGRNLHQIQRCRQLFVGSLDSSQHRFLQKVFRNFFIDEVSSEMNLDVILKNVLLKVVVKNEVGSVAHGRTSIFGRRTFPVARSAFSWWVTTYVEVSQPVQLSLSSSQVDKWEVGCNWMFATSITGGAIWCTLTR